MNSYTVSYERQEERRRVKDTGENESDKTRLKKDRKRLIDTLNNSVTYNERNEMKLNLRCKRLRQKYVTSVFRFSSQG